MGSSRRFLMLLFPTSLLFRHHHCSASSLLRLSGRRIQLPFHYHHHSFPPQSLAPNSKNRKNALFFLLKPSPRHFHTQTASANFGNSSMCALPQHPWPEFSALLNNLSASGYFNYPSTSHEFAAAAFQFPEEFLGELNACLAFARDRADLLRLLSRKEIEVVVQNGKPFLFNNGDESSSRLRVFLDSGESNVGDVYKANNMVDLMRFLLSYASNVTASLEGDNLYNKELVEPSVRHLLGELAKLSNSPAVSNYYAYEQTQLSDRSFGKMPRSSGQNIEMKRGDWICPRCNFMNFARNVKCLECEEARPKKLLSGGEWECPKCDFFNYGRNTVCLRCDCRRPGQVSLGNTFSSPGLAYSSENSSGKTDLDRRLADNEEKVKRWFSKVSQLESTSDMSSAIADEDFPEIIPLRRGVNRFVVSTRKTPLERRLANAQYKRNMNNDGIPECNDSNTGKFNKTLDAKVGQSLDKVLGRSSNDFRINSGVENPVSTSTSPMQDGHPRRTDSNYVSFVPFTPDYFAKKDELQPEGTDSSAKETGETSTFMTPEKHTEELPEVSVTEGLQPVQNQRTQSWSLKTSGENLNEIRRDTAYMEQTSGYSNQNSTNPQTSYNDDLSSGYFGNDSSKQMINSTGSSPQPSGDQNVRSTWTGKSLEGSAVKEPDPLDMSEEAKAERWFRRVAQIKDISELSQIPDEDFPSIMPMRKGVNRFVVSKRKTPQERRLTSQQYRRNPPVMNLDPGKNDSDSS